MRALLEKLSAFRAAVTALNLAATRIGHAVEQGGSIADPGGDFYDLQELVAEALIELEAAYNPDAPE